MSRRVHQFEDGGFVARALVRRPLLHYQLILWMSDIHAFTGDPNPAEHTVDHWFCRIIRGIRETGFGCYAHVFAPNSPPQNYFVVPIA